MGNELVSIQNDEKQLELTKRSRQEPTPQYEKELDDELRFQIKSKNDKD